ncbi:unnamed protein product, partial [Amoebophrya sp. A25]
KHYWRASRGRRFLAKQRGLAATIQARVRTWRVQRGRQLHLEARDLLVSGVLLLRWRLRDKWREQSVIRVQTRWRGWRVRRAYLLVRHFEAQKRAALIIQKHVRRLLAMRNADRRRFQRLYVFAAAVLQRKSRQFLAARALHVLSLVQRYASATA